MIRTNTLGYVLMSLIAMGCKPATSTEPQKEAAKTEAPTKMEETKKVPDNFTVKLATTKGDLLLDVHREWAPKGADRFYELVTTGYFKDVAFFRVLDGFMAQAGIHGDPAVNKKWRANRIQDDPVKQSNTRGMVSFATSGPNSRTTQFFVNFKENKQLDGMGFAPFAEVKDMTVVDALYNGYGEGAPRGQGPSQKRMQTEGNAYLKKAFPKLDYILDASIVE
jgi:peptidyl-prolyl cis-trans isomerase A (cyclophilin A)